MHISVDDTSLDRVDHKRLVELLSLIFHKA
jgi:hypothetical protein